MPRTPPVDDGTLFVIGGAEDKIGRRDLLQRFVRRAGNGRIAVVPTASSLGLEVVELYDALFRRLGARDVVAVRPESRSEAQDPRLAMALTDSDAVFMTGGNQLKLASVIVGTAFGAAIRAVYERGGLVGGTSAGASIVSEHMVSFGTGGATPRHRMSQLARGLGLLPDVVVDQHFRERDRYGRLLSLIAQSPSLLGIGIDEDTAAIVTDGLMEVAGRGAVTVIDTSEAVSSAANARGSQPILVSGAIVHVLPAGARFDLENRVLYVHPTALPSAQRAEIAATEAATEADLGRLVRRIARLDVHSPARSRGGQSAQEAQMPEQDPRSGPGPHEPAAGLHDQGGDVSETDRPAPAGPAQSDLTILETRVYRGPNVWSYDPAIHLLVDLGSLEDYPTSALPGFTDRLLELLPGVGRHSCSRGHRGGFAARLHEGTWLGHVAEHVALQLQQETGADIRRGKTRGAGPRGQYNVIYGYADERVALSAGRLAVRLVNDLVESDPEFDFETELETFLLRAERTAFGPSTQAIIEEAASRDIPYLRLNEGSLVQLGQGVHQKRIRATMTSNTSALAVDIAGDKDLTTRLLAAAGLPVPKQESVRTADQAAAAARRIGYPVVVKPLDGNHGRGVVLNLSDEQSVRDGFVVAEDQSRGGWVIVESYITGKDYRVLVIGGKMVALAERMPAHVIGDGVHTVSELVDETNADPRRGVGHEKVLTRIKVDDAAIALVREQGYELDEVPGAAVMVKLTLTGNMSTGGISIDRTFEAHPDNVDIAEEAARVVGLDVAGIDFISPDISEPVRETGGAICEVNAAPGFRMHTHPTIGDPQFIAKPVVDSLFAPGSPSRIPIVAVTGTNGKTTTSRMIAHIFKGMGNKVGMTSTDGVVIDERLVIRADASGPKSARMVLQNPRVDFAVFEVARGGILREGLGYERNDVAVVLNVAPDHLGLRGINTLEQLAAVKRVIVEAVPRSGFSVLNADDDLVRAMSRHSSGDVIWFSMQATGTPVRDMIDDHCRQGGRAVVLDRSELGDMIVIRHGRRSMQLAWTHLLPATFGGRAKMNVQNAMGAAGAAFAAGAPLHDIRQGLRTFTTDYYLSPGRLNLVDVHGVSVIVDYCHNAPGMKALGAFVEEQAASQAQTAEFGKLQRIGMVATAGDRRDDDMRELGAIAAEHFDVVVVREDTSLRGRARGEVAGLVAEGVRATMAAGGRCKQLEVVLEEIDAVRHCMARANPGDLVVLCVDKHGAVMAEIEALSHTAQPGAHTGDAIADPDVEASAAVG